MKKLVKIFYFIILNIAKFGQIHLWIICHLRKHHKIEKKNYCSHLFMLLS
jgi:hypothetical protein